MPFPVLPSNGSSAYSLTKSVRLRASASAYMTRTPASASNRQTFTHSFWMKRGLLGESLYQMILSTGSGGSNRDVFYFPGDSSQKLSYYTTAASLNNIVFQTNQVFRDISAWYHIVLAVDTTQATASNRFKLYVNGSQVTSFAIDNMSSISQNTNMNTNNTIEHDISRDQVNAALYFDGYLAEYNFIDGQALAPSSFGSTNSATGVWQPAKYTGTYGTNGFYLPFTDNSTTTSGSNVGIGKDFSGNGNYWNTNNISLANGTYSSLTSGSGTYTVPAGVTSLSYLVVAGGGGGASWGGGGGAGGLLQGTMTVTPGQTISYSVGTGGAGGTTWGNGTSGNNSTFGALTAIGGGGGTADTTVKNGGSGGGSAFGSGGGPGTNVGLGTAGQGNNGGLSSATIPYQSGGGGAGAVGGNGGGSASGAGGSGLTWINGTTYAGGGGGGGGQNAGGNWAGGSGGSGGGGAGGQAVAGTAGTANTGGGGGGGGRATNTPQDGGAGGSGIIIVAYGTSTTYDSMTDVPTLTDASTANYSVINPLMGRNGISTQTTISNGNLTATHTPTAYGTYAWSSFGVSSGKYYVEINVTSLFGGASIGIDTGATVSGTYNYVAWYQSSGNKYVFGSSSSYGSSWTTGDVIGIALDMTAGTVTFYKNNVSQGVAATGLTGNYFIQVVSDTGSVYNWNFGQRGFTYTPPTGYVALNTYNLPTPTIAKGNTVMDVSLYTGNGSTQSITNSGFYPDFTWIKCRNQAGYGHELFDSVRGATKYLISNSANAESTQATSLTAFNSNGFSVGSWGFINDPSDTEVAWQWNAGSGSSSSNTSGSITSTVSVNASAGFSIVTYTGTGSNATVGHGLGVAPAMIIVKRRNSTGSWDTYHQSVGNTKALFLNQTSSENTDIGYWNNTSPTFSVFTVGIGTEVNQSTGTYVAYCWAEIAGYSKFSSYTGNGSADGPFVYLGFRPKFVLLKVSSGTTANWVIVDTARNIYNVMNSQLNPDASDAEYSGSNIIDAVSNGFKLRNTPSTFNGSGNTYIFAAFAENPFKYALAR